MTAASATISRPRGAERKKLNADLRLERGNLKTWVSGGLYWGLPWCAGPGSLGHQSCVTGELICEGCCVRLWIESSYIRPCRAEIRRLMDLLNPKPETQLGLF